MCFSIIYVFESNWIIAKELLGVKVGLTLTEMIPDGLSVGEFIVSPDIHRLYLLVSPCLIVSHMKVALLPIFNRFIPTLVFFL